MNHESPTAHRANRRRWLIGLVLAFVTLLAFPFLLLWHNSRSAGRRLEELQQAIRAKNQPLTPEELNEFYATPAPEADMTPLILDGLQPLTSPAFSQAAQPLPIVGRSEAPIPPPGQPWADLEAAEKLLDQFAPSLRKFHQAARMHGSARFPVDFRQGMATLLPDTQNLRTGARLLTLEAHVRAHRGDARGAVESIQALLSLAESLENEPVLISQLVRNAIRSVGYSLIRDLLPHVDFTDDDLQALQLAVRTTDYRSGIHRGLMGERVLGLHAFRNPSGAGLPAGAVPFVGLIGGGSQDQLLYLSLMSDMIDATEHSWSDARLAESETDTRIRGLMASKTGRLRHVMTMLIFPAVTPSTRAGSRGEAQQRGTDIAIAVERFRRRHGRLPEKLDSLVPEFLATVPLDPFDGQPMRYKFAGDEILIYSVGADGWDGGGSQLPGKDEPDIVIRLTKPASTNPAPPE